MKIILLTKGAHAIIDDEDFEDISKFTWCLNTNSYAVRTIWLGKDERPKQRHFSMHRQIMRAGSSQLVDHINGNRLDNRRSNLRLSTKSQNGANRGKPRHNSTGYKGVVKHTTSNGWMAQIRVAGKNIYLGYYSTPQLAAHAYNEAARLHFGEFAALNEM